ncbi:hypothetical protein [Actinoplanes derwentensis]|uniref:hypothetical protein n=1 Tax=Actinoplanes derwentensis TaxID=113562 RepID=UPI0012FD54DC|nr:hypothetical protein [Actinoplanes derwentensis]
MRLSEVPGVPQRAFQALTVSVTRIGGGAGLRGRDGGAAEDVRGERNVEDVADGAAGVAADPVGDPADRFVADRDPGRVRFAAPPARGTAMAGVSTRQPSPSGRSAVTSVSGCTVTPARSARWRTSKI